MFASLDRIDVVSARTDGRKVYWQTDHRTAEEIEREPALSVLFALTRILNPQRYPEPGSPEPVMVYSAMHPPPAFLRRAILAAGARLAVGDDLSQADAPPERASASGGDAGGFLGRAMRGIFGGRGSAPARSADGAAPLDGIVQQAFADLAGAVAVEHGVALTVDGLQAVEDAVAAAAVSQEEDETAYWSAVFRLGAFGGEVLRALNGGRWTTGGTGTLPFVLSTTYRGGQSTVNPLGKAIKRFANGEEDSLVALVNVVRGNR